MQLFDPRLVESVNKKDPVLYANSNKIWNLNSKPKTLFTNCLSIEENSKNIVYNMDFPAIACLNFQNVFQAAKDFDNASKVAPNIEVAYQMLAMTILLCCYMS